MAEADQRRLAATIYCHPLPNPPPSARKPDGLQGEGIGQESCFSSPPPLARLWRANTRGRVRVGVAVAISASSPLRGRRRCPCPPSATALLAPWRDRR